MGDDVDPDELEKAYLEFQLAIQRLVAANTGLTYNAINSWALVVRATANDGDGDHEYGGLFMPPNQDKFVTAGLKWTFEQGFDNMGRHE